MVNRKLVNFTLRPFMQSDAEAMAKGLNTPRIERDMTIELPWDRDKASWWISFITRAAKQNPLPEIHFVIEVGGKFAGSIGIINIEGHKAEIGYWLIDKHHKKGIMTAAISKIIAYAHEVLELERVFAPVLTHNKQSARVLEKNGFINEGILHKYYLKNGRYVDAYCYAWIG